MKRVISLICAVALLLCSTACAPRETYEATVTELGIPLKDVYPQGGMERCVWDVEFYKDALYVGSGDYDRNRGPVYMTHYDFEAAEWEIDDVLNDEQVERFYIFDDVLYAAGYDSRGSWDFGNYFTCRETGDWETHNTLPNGVHNFDMIKFNGKLFAGLGVEEGESPVVVSTDEETWEQVPLLKDGKPRETHGGTFIRVYDFFTLNNTLYAYFSLSSDVETAREIYRYDGENFVYHSIMTRSFKFKCFKYGHFSHKSEFKGYQYLGASYLYRTADMTTGELIDLGENVEVNDSRVIGKALYLLCDEKITHDDGSEEFRISVKKSKNGTDFTELFYFHYPVRALSFTYNKGTFYFGMGYGSGTDKYFNENGMVLSVDYQ